ncbi:MAG: hypothetical protein LUQ12_03610 [Methanoregulaceae archaeon]|nr:hypothetical protein [Methanoregulaceae archaeon]
MEGKLRENAGNAVKAILETAGFEVQEVEAPVDFSAMREGEVLLVLCSNDSAEIEEFDRTRFSLKVDDKELECRKLVFSLEEKVQAENSIIWGVKEFVRYAGEAALARVLGRTLSLSFASAPDEASPAKESRTQAEAPSGITLPHLPIKVGRQAAEKIAGVSGNTTLRFMPHWFFHYVSSGEQVYKDHRVLFDGDGSGAINAINGIRIELDGSAAAEKEIPADSEVVKPKISKEQAAEQVYKDLIDQLTKLVRIKQVKGDAIFYEEKVIRPERTNIQLDLAQVFVPVWQVRGKKIVEVNATTGDILAVPMDEGVEIL